MNDEVEGKEKDQKRWLKEHDTIQVDLLKMKDELMEELNGMGTGPSPPRRPETPSTPRAPERAPVQGSSPPRAPQELTIKQMLGGNDQSPRKEAKDSVPKEPPKLPEGKIPTAPDLTSKIASVLQLEDKLKRRKFELEKRSRENDVPPPPTRPVMKEETVMEKVDDDTVKGAHEIELTRYAVEEEEEEEEDQFEEVEELEEHVERDVPEKPRESSERKTISQPVVRARVTKDNPPPQSVPKRDHKEERKKKRRGIWALFGRG